MRRFAFRVEYDGTGYAGWQSQAGLATIEGELEIAFEKLLGESVKVDGASRTDAGVHARGQLAAASFEHPFEPFGLVKALNNRLPDQIAIRDAVEVPLDFVPRFSTAGKTYCYRFYTSRTSRPLIDRFAWRLLWPLDLERLALCAEQLVGTRDFQSFAAKDGTHKTSVRTLTKIALREDHQPGLYALTFEGTGFLKQMIRNLTGTMVEIARGHGSPNDIPAILAARDRCAAGPTAPARGLTLECVHPKPELIKIGN